MRSSRLFPTLAVFLLAACGGGDSADTVDDTSTPAAEPAPEPSGPAMPSGAMSMPEWYEIDEANQTVTLTLTAGSTNRNNHWNYNGAINGELAVNVPEGYTVNITLINEDPNMPHSAVISSELSNFATPPSPEPVFAGSRRLLAGVHHPGTLRSGHVAVLPCPPGGIGGRRPGTVTPLAARV